MSDLIKKTLKWSTLLNVAVTSFNLTFVPTAGSNLLQVLSGINLLRFLLTRQWRKVIFIALCGMRFALAQVGTKRSGLGHLLHDLIRIYRRSRLNMPPSILRARVGLRHGPFARHKTDLEVAQKLGPICCANRFGLGGSNMFVLLSDPAAVQKVMTDKVTFPSRGPSGFTDVSPNGLLGLPSGEMHTKHRRLIGKFMSNNYLQSFSDVITEETEVLINKWIECAEEKKASNVCYDLSMMTLQVIMRTAVGTTGYAVNQQHFKEEDNDEYHNLDYALKEILVGTAIPFLGLHPTPMLRWIKYKSEQSFQKIMQQAEIMNDKKLLAPNIFGTLKELGSKGNPEDALTDKEIMDEMLTVRGAGHETTSNTLSWSMLLLSQHPECLEKLLAEVDAGIAGKVATYEEVQNLSYTHMVVYETLRLYPTVPSFPRQAACDTKILGYDIPKGSMVLVCQNPMNKSHKLWDSPLEFMPERFKKVPELIMSRPVGIPDGHKYGFIPFGAGNRTCVGQRLAMLEAVQILASVAKNVSWKVADPSKEIEEVADITLGPKKGLDMIFTPRTVQ